MMKRISNLKACLLISVLLHAAVITFGILPFRSDLKEKPFEVVFKVDQEILPPVYEIKAEKRIKPFLNKPEELISEKVFDSSFQDEEFQESLLRYQDSIKEKIQANKRYPRWAMRAKQQGAARLIFIVLSSGQLKDLELVQSSGFAALDQAALEAVKRASPFFPFPETLSEEAIQIEVDLVFSLNGKNKF